VKARSALAEAKKELLARGIAARGGTLVLSHWIYDQLRENGLSRAEVNAAVDALVDAGEAALETGDARVVVHLTGGAE